MVDAVALVGRLLLALIFAVAALAKLRDQAGTSEALESFGVPRGLLKTSSVFLPAAEVLAAVLLILPATYVLGAVMSLVLLTAFTLAIGVNLARGNRPSCRCFGEMSSSPIGLATIARNVALAAIAGYVLFAAPMSIRGVQSWYDSLGPQGRPLAVASAVLTGLLATSLALLARTTDRARAAEEKLVLGGVKLAIGEVAPDFTLPTVQGGTLDLGELLGRGKPVILAFTDPHCGPCQALVPQLAMWQKSLANVFTVGIISRGTLEDNAEHFAEHGLSEVMLQSGDEVANDYGAGATPSAVRISPEGLLETSVVMGIDDIIDLFEAAIAEHAQSLWQRATGGDLPPAQVGLPVGAEAPDLSALDLDERSHRLLELADRPTLLLFWSPRCGYCHQMLDDIRLAEQKVPSGRHIVFVTIGTPEENRYLGLDSLMLIDGEMKVMSAFQVGVTPSAVLLEDGKVATPVESGTEDVLALTHRFVGGVPHRVSPPSLRSVDN